MSRTKIYSHKYADLFFDENISIIEEIWKSETKHMTDEEYKSYQMDKVAETKKVMPKLFLCDTQNFLYTMIPEIQEWTDEQLNKFWAEIGLQKFAMIMSKGDIEQIGLELAMSEREEEELGYDFQFFDSQEKAKEWLLS